MTAFEQGYAAFVPRAHTPENPFDKETAPHSFRRFVDGWNHARLMWQEKNPC